MRIAVLLRHSVIREWAFIFALLVAGSVCALRWDWFFRLDQTLYDKAIELIQRPPQDDIVIVAIDEESLAQIGRFPWSRVVHATLLERLTRERAKAIAFDVVFTEPDKREPGADRVLGEAMRNNGRVILPVDKSVLDDQIAGETLPVPELSEAAARLAHIDTEIDPDGIVRSVFLRAGFGAARYPSMALAMLSLEDPVGWPAGRALPGTANPNRARAGFLMRDYLYVIPYAGPPRHFKRISYVDVLRGDTPPGTFSGKYVMIGTTAAGLRDEFPTPVSGQTSAMPGIEIHANILQGLREGIDIRRAGVAVTGAIAIALLLAVMLAYFWLRPRQSLLLTAGVIAVVFAGTVLIFSYAHLWISPVVPVAVLLLAYPLWSWRKLEAAQHFLDEELARLQREPIVVPQETAQRIAPNVGRRLLVPDAIESRIVALQTATERMRNLNRFVADSLESVPEVVLVTDSTGRILFANTSAHRMVAAFGIKGAPSEKLKTLDGYDLFELLALLRHGDARPWREIWTQAYEDMHPASLEATGPEDHELLVQIAPSFSARGVRTGSIVTMVDVSPLRESERRRDEALRFLSHDMRSPQASILTLLEMQREEPAMMPVDRLVERIGKYSRRTLNLADDFLRLAKAERSKPQDFALLELQEVMRDAAEEAWALAETRKISVNVEAEEHDDAWVMGDRDLMTRVLINLLSNAIKYSPANTRVSLGLQSDGGNWRINVTDQGYGIAQNDMSKLFTRFTRLKNEGHSEEDGIGLGLVFVKTVVERHHGSINVTSKTAQGKGAERSGESGTTFSVTLPAAVPPAVE